MTTAPPPPTRFKLLATDLDGTLLDRSGAIHERDRRAIAELQRRGVAVTTLCPGFVRMHDGDRSGTDGTDRTAIACA
jgi:FMN phosphatase YigB (HAD superfamily)